MEVTVMYDISQMRQLKIRTGLSYKEIADRSGVPLGTVQKVFMGVTTNPRKGTIEKLNTAFTGDLPGMEMRSVLDDGSGTYKPVPYTMFREGQSRIFLRDAARAYNDFDHVDIDPENLDRQGTYTMEDVDSLPDSVKAELVDGYIYIKDSARYEHQIVASKLDHYFEAFIEVNNGDCMVTQDARVKINNDENTLFYPDVSIVCDPSIIRKGNVYGAPDLIVEILSDSTKDRDWGIKKTMYIEAGVKEYWIINITSRQIIIFENTFDGDFRVKVYGFDDTIPVGIYDGKLRIDFSRIAEVVDRIMDKD
jgi:Uma2 family endonuclease/transcriptional regulator with XRE-family HTH domain